MGTRSLCLPECWCSCYIRPHFRRSALDEVGGWDPYNVTEDADLGLRLFRFGYLSDTITRPTREDAPEALAEWLPQRTRWFKGWMQTWLVHMRHPAMLAGDLGWASFAVSQVLFLGLLMSALIHPIYLVTMGWIGLRMAFAGPVDTFDTALFIIDATNIALGYGAFLALGMQTLLPGERRGLWKVVLCTPLYWLLLSAAAWRSIAELYLYPHRWNKTAHRPTRRDREAKGSTGRRSGG